MGKGQDPDPGTKAPAVLPLSHDRTRGSQLQGHRYNSLLLPVRRAGAPRQRVQGGHGEVPGVREGGQAFRAPSWEQRVHGTEGRPVGGRGIPKRWENEGSSNRNKEGWSPKHREGNGRTKDRCG